MPSDTAAENGFTLIEVLVAFVILSTALVAANQSLSYSFRAFTAAKMSRSADHLAEEVFAERIGLPGVPKQEKGEGPDGLTWTLGWELLSLEDALTAEKWTLDVIAPTGKHVRRYIAYRPSQTDEAGDDQ